MVVFTIMNLISTVVFLKDLMQWLANKKEYEEFMSTPPTRNIGIFVPIASLSMTANVILAPLAFFIPKLSANIQALMLPGLIFFGFLWLMLFKLEFKVLKTWLSQPIDVTQLNFIWLIDVFAFGLVNLTGTGIASMANIILFLITFSYVITIGWGIFTLYLLSDYLKKDFYKSEFSPTQWSMV